MWKWATKAIRSERSRGCYAASIDCLKHSDQSWYAAAGLGPALVMAGLEARHVPYLFTLRLTKSEKHYIQTVFWHDDWEDAGQGWEGRAGELVLTGWATSRRVVRLRRSLTGDVLLADKSHQLELAFVESEVPAKRCEYAPWSPNCRMRS